MNFLRIFSQNISTMKGKYLLEKLPHRDIIRVSGSEVINFLQGLITNDMKHLNSSSQSMYAMFLNKNGRVLYDSIIFKTIQPDTYLIECDKEISAELKRHLRMFRIRKKIDIDSIGTDYSTWVLFDPKTNNEIIKLPKQTVDIVSSTDPRLQALGNRIIVPISLKYQDIIKVVNNEIEINESDEQNNYKLHRLKLGVGEGIVDHPPTKCFALETNCDYLHGVSFHKGCYIGQELTARIYHTGTIRKRLMPVILAKNLTEHAEHVQLMNGNNVGIIRDVKGKFALALIRIEQAMKANQLLVNHEKAEVIKPVWWPDETTRNL